MKQKRRDLYIDDSKTTVPVSYNRRNGYSIPIYQYTPLSLRLKKQALFNFVPESLCIVYKCSYYIGKIDLIIGKSKIEERNIKISDDWEELRFDISPYSFLLHNALNTYIDFIKLIICPLPPAPAVQFQIKEMYIRPFADTEKQKQSVRLLYEKRKSSSHINLYKYLKHTTYKSVIKQVNVLNDFIEINGNIPVGIQQYFLCEIPMFADFSTNEFGKKITITPSDSDGFCIRVSRLTGEYGKMYDSLYSRWAIVTEIDNVYCLASYAKYAENVYSTGAISTIVARSKKGLGDFQINNFESDLDELDISYITVNIRINDFLCSRPDGLEDTILFEYNGKKYYTNKKKILEYDSIMLSAYKRNIIVSAIILVYPESLSKDKMIGRILEHPCYMPSGAYSMPNMTTLESLNLYAAGIDFLSSRYSHPDALYGHIHRWIVHNEIDAGIVWTNAGRKEVLSYIDIYMKSLRLVYYTAQKYNKNTEVFIPFTHYWKVKFDHEYYLPSEMLEMVLLYSQKEGDFKWGIAHHTYPEELFEPQSWLDKNITFDFNTPLITFKNLEVLDAWVKQKYTFFQKSEPRRLILSEQNPNSKDYSKRELEKQAACLAYAWKKMQACSSIEAYIAHSWIDAHFEGGLKTGLRKYPDDNTDPYGIKPAWEVYKSLGTERETEVCEFAKNIIGIEDWEEIYEPINKE